MTLRGLPKKSKIAIQGLGGGSLFLANLPHVTCDLGQLLPLRIEVFKSIRRKSFGQAIFRLPPDTLPR